jgi:hypothetical protein
MLLKVALFKHHKPNQTMSPKVKFFTNWPEYSKMYQLKKNTLFYIKHNEELLSYFYILKYIIS